MASFIWFRDSQEAIENKYEYHAEEQFVREAKKMINSLKEILLNKKQFYFYDKSLEKATWMLQTDVLFAFNDSIEALDNSKHRVVGPLLRAMYENMHLIEYLNSDSKKANKTLIDWYNNITPKHIEYRKYIEVKKGTDEAFFLKHQYDSYSKLTHRSYLSLLYNYSRSGNRHMEKYDNQQDYRIRYDDSWPLRQSLSMYYAILGLFGLEMIKNLIEFGILTEKEVKDIWNDSMEKEQIPRGYISPEEKEMFGLNNN